MRATVPISPSGGRRSSSVSSTPRHHSGQRAWSCRASQTGWRGDSSSQVVRKAYSAIGARRQFRCGVSPLPMWGLGDSVICEKRITVTVSSSRIGLL